MQRVAISSACSQLRTTEQVGLARLDGSIVLHLHGIYSRSYRQVDKDDGVFARQVQRVAISSACSQLRTTEQVGLARLDGSIVLHLHGIYSRSGSLHLQRQGHGTIATTTYLLQGIGGHRVRLQLLATEQIGLSGLYRGSIGGSLQRGEEQVKSHRTIAERIGLRARRGELLATEEVCTGAAHSSIILRIDSRGHRRREERQQG